MSSTRSTCNTHSTNCNPAREGAALVVMASVLTALSVLFLALTVDTGYLTSRQTDLQAAVNAAAAGSAPDLAQGPDAVVNSVARIAAARAVADSSIRIAKQSVEIGRWDNDRQLFTADTRDANAVRVVANIQDEGFLFAPVIGCRVARLQAQAIALRNSRGGVSLVESCPAR